MIEPGSFRVWIVGDSAEDAEEFIGYRDAEHAATDFAYQRAHSPDHDDFVDGDPVQVFVADSEGKVLGCYEVGAECEVRITCEEIDLESMRAEGGLA